jgi:hypothetical protein
MRNWSLLLLACLSFNACSTTKKITVVGVGTIHVPKTMEKDEIDRLIEERYHTTQLYWSAK